MSKIAYGSLSTTIGDATLGYSSGVSFKAQEVCGLYIDIPPVLSRNYSTLLWQYYADTDNYMVTHVQGRHTEDRAMGRIFSYRAAFEVSRDEMNRTGFSVGNIMQSIPRIMQYQKSEVWSEETEMTKYKPSAKADKVKELAQLIICAIITKRRLFISIPTQDRVLRENGIFASEEFRTLIEAIDTLDISIRRYASFAFCADEHYQKSLSDILITIYVRESNIQVPQEAMKLDFEQMGTQFSIQEKVSDFISILKTMPGAKEKLLPLSQMMQKLHSDKALLDKVRTMKHTDFTPSDYKIWLSDNHSFNELTADSWTGFNHLLTLLADNKEKKQLFERHKHLFAMWFSGAQGTSIMKNFEPLGFISTYKDIFDAETIISIVSALDANRNMLLVDSLIQKSKSSGKVANDIIQRSLRNITSRKINDIGTDVDRWLKLLSQLKDKEGNPLKKSSTYYLSRISEMSEEDQKELRNNIFQYEKQHPRIAQSERFMTLMKVVHLTSEKKKKMITEPKSPSNSKMQEDNGYTSNGMAKDNEYMDEFDQLYQRLQTEEKQSAKKGKIIYSALSFIVGIALSAGIFFALQKDGNATSIATKTSPNGNPITVDSLQANVNLTDSTPHILSQLALAGDTTHCIAPDSVLNIDDLKQVTRISQFDSIYASWIRKYADTLKIKEIKVKW